MGFTIQQLSSCTFRSALITTDMQPLSKNGKEVSVPTKIRLQLHCTHNLNCAVSVAYVIHQEEFAEVPEGSAHN